MNEIDLIKEVEKRPILYDKSVSGFNKTKLRDDAWKEVQEALNVSVTRVPNGEEPHNKLSHVVLFTVSPTSIFRETIYEHLEPSQAIRTEGFMLKAECKKRWRSLRDSFIKLQRTHGGRTRWPYLHAMRFLLPHVEPKNDTPTKRETSDSEPEEEIRHRPGHSLPDLSFQDSRQLEDDEDSQPGKKMRLNSTDEDPCQCNRTDPDELFLLSCAPTLKRLNSKQNAVARLKIQQVLYEAEFGSQMELPYVTPASDCGYDVENSVE